MNTCPDILRADWHVPPPCRAAYIRAQKQKQQARLTGLPRSPGGSLSRESSLASSAGRSGLKMPGKLVMRLRLEGACAPHGMLASC